MPRARSNPNFAASFSSEGFTLVLIWPPLRLLHPYPGSSASTTSVERPPRAVVSAALSPVYPAPTISTSTLADGCVCKAGMAPS